MASLNSELMVFAFPGEKDASKAESALRMMRERQLLGLQYAASFSKDSTGKSEIRLRLDLPVNLEDRRLWLLCQFVNSFCASDTESLQLLVEAGMDRPFLDKLREQIVPGTSALFIYAPPESRADIQIVQTVLSLFRGKLFHAAFPETVGEAVLAHIMIREES